MLKLSTRYSSSSHPNHHRFSHEFDNSPRHRPLQLVSCLHHQSTNSSGFEVPNPRLPLAANRRSLLFLSSALSLPPLFNASAATTPETSDPPPPPPPTQRVAAADTTITDRVYLDFSICPTYFRSDRTQTQTPQAQTQGSDFTPCPDAEPMGRVVLGLYGKLVPTTVANFKAMCTGRSGSSYKNTAVHKILPGQFFVAGRQGNGREKGAISGPPLSLARNTETVESKAFMLEHSRPGVVSLCLSENDDDDEAKLDPDYHNVEFLITTGPGPCPQLDGRNIVFGTVLEGLDVITSIAAVPTYKPAERIKQFNDLAEFFGDERAQNARTLWDRPLKSIYISDCGELQVAKPSLTPTLP